MPKTVDPEITVVYPVFDLRGQAADRVRTCHASVIAS